MIELFKLRNGIELPTIGFGTFLIETNQAADAVKNAITTGYRHIDTC